MASVQGGLLADGLTVTLSGLLGGMASDTSASNVALSQASGATSRVLAYWAGGLFALLAFSPRLTAVLALIPDPVVGAILVYIIALVISSGLRMMVSKPLSPASGYVLGTALVVGLSLDMLSQLYLHLPAWLRPLFSSSLTLSTVVAILLTQLLRLLQRPAAS
jgi:xanthine permease XanP